MYILEFLISTRQNEIRPRKLEKFDDGWYDEELNVQIFEPGLYTIDVDTMEVCLVDSKNVNKFHKNIYFLACKNKVSLSLAMLAFAMGRSGEQWKSEQWTLLN